MTQIRHFHIKKNTSKMALILSPREMANVCDIEYKGVTLCLSPDL